MNKKGFTLVELLGAIAILSLLVVIMATNGFGLLNKVKGTINKIEEDNLLEAARAFLVEVDKGICDADSDLCEIDNYIGQSKNIKVQFFIENGYFKDDAKHCDGTKELKLQIVQDDNGNTTEYKVEKNDSSDVICTK